MDFLKWLVAVYLIVGFVYAFYIFLFAGDKWYWFPVNVAGGPIALLYLAIVSFPMRKRSYKEIFGKKKAAVFDLDGTIAATEDVWKVAFENVARTFGPALSVDRSAGEYAYEVWAKFLDKYPDRGIKLTARELTDHTHAEFLKYLDGVEIAEGFWDIAVKLQAEKGYKLALVTNTDKVVAERVLRRLELSKVFDVVVFGDDVEKRKPDPKIYRLVLRKLGVKAAEAIAFEDSVAGSTAAKRAGVDTIVIWDGNVPAVDYPRGIIDFLSDFTKLDELVDKDMREVLKGLGDNR